MCSRRRHSDRIGKPFPVRQFARPRDAQCVERRAADGDCVDCLIPIKAQRFGYTGRQSKGPLRGVVESPGAHRSDITQLALNLVRRRQGGEKVAAVSFVLFGLWTIRGDQLDGEDKRFSFSPFWTVAIAFFVAEMGDKTQLATVALAAKYKLPLAVWFGTNVGMLIADAIGIVIGIVMGKHIPDKSINERIKKQEAMYSDF